MPLSTLTALGDVRLGQGWEQFLPGYSRCRQKILVMCSERGADELRVGKKHEEFSLFGVFLLFFPLKKTIVLKSCCILTTFKGSQLSFSVSPAWTHTHLALWDTRIGQESCCKMRNLIMTKKVLLVIERQYFWLDPLLSV